jgi:hypothetical protein
MKKDIVITEKLFRHLPSDPMVVWILLVTIALSIHFIWVGIKQTEPYTPAALACGFLIILAVFSPGYVYDKINELKPTFSVFLDLPESKINDLIKQNYIEPTFNTKYMLLTGLLLPLFIMPTGFITWFNQYNQDFYIKVFDTILVVFAGYTASLSVFMWLPLLKALSKLIEQPIKTNSIFRLSEFATPISLTFAKFALIVSCAYSLMLVIVMSGPIANGVPFYFYSAVGILSTLACFIFPQIELKNIIRKAKWQILEKVSNEIQKSMDKLLEDSSPDNVARVESLIELHAKMQKLSESSLTWEGVSRLVGSVLLPVLVSLLDRLLQP